MTSLTHEFTETLAAPPERVFRPSRMRPICRAGSPSTSKWSCSPEASTASGAGTRIARRRVRSRCRKWCAWMRRGCWCFPGASRTVTARSPSSSRRMRTLPARTTVKGRHHFPVAPDVPRALDLIDDLWRMNLANLRAHLGGGEHVCLPDFSDPLPRLRQTILTQRASSTCFEALLDPGVLEKWIAAKATVEPRSGRPLQLRLEIRSAWQAGGGRTHAAFSSWWRTPSS